MGLDRLEAEIAPTVPGCVGSGTIERYIVVGGPGLGMQYPTKFVWGSASSDLNSNKRVLTALDLTVVCIKIGFLVL
jgi:hypothetical protein